VSLCQFSQIAVLFYVPWNDRLSFLATRSVVYLGSIALYCNKGLPFKGLHHEAKLAYFLYFQKSYNSIFIIIIFLAAAKVYKRFAILRNNRIYFFVFGLIFNFVHPYCYMDIAIMGFYLRIRLK